MPCAKEEAPCWVSHLSETVAGQFDKQIKEPKEAPVFPTFLHQVGMEADNSRYLKHRG
jgi:hypothetical protein